MRPVHLLLALLTLPAATAACGSADSPSAAAGATPAPASQESLAASAPPATGTPQTGARCRTGDLTGTLSFGPGSGTAGSRYGTLALRNTGAATCTLAGFPGVSLVDASGQQLGAAATRSTAAYDTVELAAGDRAQTRLRVADIGVFEAHSCRPTKAAGVRVYPPGSRAALTIEQDLMGCTGDQHVLTVGPLTPAG